MNIFKKVVSIFSVCLLSSTIIFRYDVQAACPNPGWNLGYYKNKIVINTYQLPELYVQITKNSVIDWNLRSTGYSISTVSTPPSVYGFGEGKNYVSAYALENNNSTTGRTTVITTNNNSWRKGTSFLIVYNTGCYDSMDLSVDDRKKYCRSVMGHELGHVLSLGDMDTGFENNYGSVSIMSYSRNRMTLISPTNTDANWVKYYK